MLQPDVIVAHSDGAEGILCLLVQHGAKIVVVANSRHPGAEEHARQHIARGFGCVLFCKPDCGGTQR